MSPPRQRVIRASPCMASACRGVLKPDLLLKVRCQSNSRPATDAPPGSAHDPKRANLGSSVFEPACGARTDKPGFRGRQIWVTFGRNSELRHSQKERSDGGAPCFAFGP